ncbi:hypothetical protein BH11BAC3_BH11BAC3_22110 [soil metagenome]
MAQFSKAYGTRAKDKWRFYLVVFVDQQMFFIAASLCHSLVLIYFHGIVSHYLSTKSDLKKRFIKDSSSFSLFNRITQSTRGRRNDAI